MMYAEHSVCRCDIVRYFVDDTQPVKRATGLTRGVCTKCGNHVHVVYRHREYSITYDPKQIATRDHDWDWVHDDYDGPDDCRCGTTASVEAAKAAIDELESS